jgi:hypothetical protein
VGIILNHFLLLFNFWDDRRHKPWSAENLRRKPMARAAAEARLAVVTQEDLHQSSKPARMLLGA